MAALAGGQPPVSPATQQASDGMDAVTPRTSRSGWQVPSAGAALVAAFLAFGPAVHTAVAQGGVRPLTASSRQDLTFGTIIAGIPATVLRTDALNAGQVELRGQRNTQVRVDITLPAAMARVGGGSVPLVFGAADGGYSTSGTIATATAFDPRAPLIATLSAAGRLYVYLGGQAQPATQQTPGAYSATITVTVAYLN